MDNFLDFDEGPMSCSKCGDYGWHEDHLCRKEHNYLVAKGILTEDDFIAYNKVKPEAVVRLTAYRNHNKPQ